MTEDTQKDETVAVTVAVEDAQELPNALVILPVVIQPVVSAPEVKKVNFYQYAAGIPDIQPQHLPGLKAFVRNPDQLRTHAQWASILKDY